MADDTASLNDPAAPTASGTTFVSHGARIFLRRRWEELLGLPGAYVADLMLESLGVACFILALALLVWGWQMMCHRPARWLVYSQRQS